MGKCITALFSILTGVSAAWGGTHSLAGNFKGKIEFSGARASNSKSISALTGSTEKACGCMEKALTAMTTYHGEIQVMFKRGLNFGVYLKNPKFYSERTARRLKACAQGTITYQSVGRCDTENERLAYVKMFGNKPGATIYLCDEFFDFVGRQAPTIQHEFGRLENIGDSPNFDTDSIDVWDSIIEGLCSPINFDALKKMHDQGK